MALKIGLAVAPKGSISKQGDKKKKKTNHQVVPVISWASDMERFFWPTTSKETNQHSKAQAFTLQGQSTTTNVTMHHIRNKESFPLVLLRGALSTETLVWALSLTTAVDNDASGAEELEQHEIVDGGKIRTLRRSLVSRLDPNGELLDGILSNLPVELVGGGQHHGQGSANGRHHAYEDGSVVYYRTAQGDFYDEHHDSFSPGETLRDRQRAYTILIYLRTPPGPPLIGGTEFTRLTPLTDDNDNDIIVECAETQKGERGLLVKPSAGDALVWPNFDRDGKPYADSVHRALPVSAALPTTPPTRNKEASGPAVVQRSDTEEDTIGKVVVNLWFESLSP